MTTTAGPRAAIKTGGTNGILPVNGAQVTNPKQQPASKAGPRLKVNVRRLPPGLLEAEFQNILGDEWVVGKGRVDYFRYKQGKESKDGSKQSRPSWAVFHLTSEANIMALSDTIRNNDFKDAANTFESSCLVGPATVEYATYQRITTGRKRADARQGTIDQDPEFMAFLDSLVNPVTTKEENDEVGATEKGTKVTMTPLVQFIKDKKAKRSKEAESSKPSKGSLKQEVKTVTRSTKDSKTEELKKPGKKERLVEKAQKEAVKIMNRTVASKAESSKTAAAAAPTQETQKSARAAPRERGSITAAARILQRDLGISAGSAHRKAKADVAKTDSPIPAPAVGQTTPAQSPQKSKTRVRGGQTGGGSDTTSKVTPAAAQTPSMTLLKKPAADSASQIAQPAASGSLLSTKQTPVSTPSQSPAPTTRKQLPNPIPSANATRAFVKHANPSQGVTEPLLKSAMEDYGKVSYVEIDKRKGFAYVDFVDHEALKKAMKGSPVKVGGGTVVVLERKDGKASGSGSGAAASNQAQGHTKSASSGGGNTTSNSGNMGSVGGSGGFPRVTAGRGGRRGGRVSGRGGAAASASGQSAEGALPSGTPTGPAAKP